MVDLLTEAEEAILTNRTPSFSWIVDDARTGAGQTAFQILVASSEKELANNSGDVWDSGKVPSPSSTAVRFGGEGLQPETRYWWKVRTWDREEVPGSFSAPRHFRTGQFDPAGRRWPGERRLVEVLSSPALAAVFEDRQSIRYHSIHPVSVIRNESGNIFATFERAAFGTLMIKLNPDRAHGSIRIHLGEKADTGGRAVDRSPGGSITYQAITLKLQAGRSDYRLSLPRQVSSYPNSQTLPASLPEVVAFRFVEIEGFPGEPEAGAITQLALFYRFDDDASAFSSSSQNLNQVWELSRHTLKATPFLGMYLDGARERMPYEADAYIQQISHACVDREYAIGRYTSQFLIFNPSWPTEWHLHVVPMAWEDYMQTGNSDSLALYYDELRAKTLIALAREDGLISTRTGRVTGDFLHSVHYAGESFRDIVDWPQGTPFGESSNRSGHGSVTLEGETDRFVFSDINTVVNAFHYRNLVLMAEIARVLEKEKDATWFQERAKLVRGSFNALLLNRESGLYTDGEGVAHSSLHANMFPVAFGLAPKENYPRILAFLQSKGMACSPYGALYLLDALYALGGAEAVLALLTAESERSWMNMIRIGSTMTTEAWDLKYKKNMTWNHAWGASPAWVITRRLMGVEALDAAFGKIQIRPQPGGLRHASLTTPTIRGPVRVSFENIPGKSFLLTVEIPANTTARVILPKPTATATLTVNGEAVGPRTPAAALVVDPLPSGRHELCAE